MATTTPRVPSNSMSTDPWMTKAQIRAEFSVSKKEIDVLVSIGYLIPIRLGPRMKRFWRSDVIAGVQAFRDDRRPPTPSKRPPSKIDWEA